jgi:GNAT superfamily N-acetyltransferase
MPLALRHRDDAVPAQAPRPELSFRQETDPAAMAALQGRSEEEMRRRFDAGHRAYLALWEGAPAAWGWVATRAAEIGELGRVFEIPAGERYLWNFATLPTHRGLGIYPRLLEAIVRAEAAEAEAFWIIYAPENHASGAGIRKAGFRSVAELSFDAAGQPALHALEEEGATRAARLLGVPEVTEPLAPCWRCIRAGVPEARACAEGHCCCDYQHAEVGCGG